MTVLGWWWLAACGGGDGGKDGGPDGGDADADADADTDVDTDTDTDLPDPGAPIAFLYFLNTFGDDGQLYATFYEFGVFGTTLPTTTTDPTTTDPFDRCTVTPLGGTTPAEHTADTGTLAFDSGWQLDPGAWTVTVDGVEVPRDGVFPWVDGGAVSFSNEGSGEFPGVTATDFFFLPPRVDAALSVEPDGGVTLTWTAGPVDPTTLMGILATSRTASLSCLVTDDGSFTIPAAQAAEVSRAPFVMVTRSKFGGVVADGVQLATAAGTSQLLLP